MLTGIFHSHRHVRYSLFFHSLALIHCLRESHLSPEERARYFKQIETNQSYIRKWLSPSPVNTSTWVALIDAEMASLTNNPDAFKLYDVAVKLAVNNDWLLEGGLGLFFVRGGVCLSLGEWADILSSKAATLCDVVWRALVESCNVVGSLSRPSGEQEVWCKLSLLILSGVRMV